MLKHEQGDPTPVCTTGIINSKKGYWITAKHCMTDGPITQYLIDGKSISLIKTGDDLIDLVILQSDAKGKELKISVQSPDFDSGVHMANFMGGVIFPTYLSGKVANPYATIPAMGPRYFLIMNIVSAGGASGSPIVDDTGHLVTVAIVNFYQGAGSISPLTGGVVYKDFINFIRGYI